MKIAEVSEKYKISHDTLRYYERWVEFAACMRSAGLPIEVLIEYLSLFQQGDRTNDARKALLVEQRNQLAARIAELTKTL